MKHASRTFVAGVLALALIQSDPLAQSIGQGPGRPQVDAKGLFFTRPRAVKIGLVDYGHHAVDPALQAYIANHYDLILSGDPTLDFAYYRNVNEDIEIFSYFNSFMLALDQPAPAAENAYLHDGSVPAGQQGPSNRVGKFFENAFHYVMDPSSLQWQSHSLGQIQGVLAAGFDGVMVDDVFAHLMHEAHFNQGEPLVIGGPTTYTEFSTVPLWYDAQASHDGWRAYLASLAQQLGAIVMFNGVNDIAEFGAPIDPALDPADYLSVCDGSGQEGFVYNGKGLVDPADGLVVDEYWEATVELLMAASLAKRHSVVSYGDVNYWPGRLYALASYLIGYDPSASSTFYYTADAFTLTSLPEWSLDVGAPLESYGSLAQYKDTTHQVYVRRFAKAVVVVNPFGLPTAAIPLGGSFFEVQQADLINTIGNVALGAKSGLAFVPISSIQLGSYSATILMTP